MNVYRYVENSRRKNIKYLNHTHEIGDYIEPFYINRKNEIVTILCLDCKKKVLCFQEIFEGSFNSAQISIKKIIELVVKFNAAYVVISHNHPMGLAIPSTVDKETTRKIEDILTGMGVVLLDHLLFADGDYVSFAESGYLKSDRLNSNYFGYTSMNGDVHQETKLAAVLNDEGEDSKD